MTERLNDLLRNDSNIGLQRLRVTHRVDARHINSAKKLGLVLMQNNGDFAHALQYKLHNNSAVASTHFFGDNTPLSAYFVVNTDGLKRSLLTVIWGKQNQDGGAKVHSYLNEHPTYNDLRKNALLQRSGHLANITVPNTEETVHIALIDSLRSRNGISVVTKTDPEYPIATTLLANYVIPITSDGYVVITDKDCLTNEARTFH